MIECPFLSDVPQALQQLQQLQDPPSPALRCPTVPVQPLSKSPLLALPEAPPEAAGFRGLGVGWGVGLAHTHLPLSSPSGTKEH